jgi:hypothetical protein
MRYWVFHESQLSAALAAREAERMKEGATEQQAKDETLIVAQFLTSEAARPLFGGYVKP